MGKLLSMISCQLMGSRMFVEASGAGQSVVRKGKSCFMPSSRASRADFCMFKFRRTPHSAKKIGCPVCARCNNSEHGETGIDGSAEKAGGCAGRVLLGPSACMCACFCDDHPRTVGLVPDLGACFCWLCLWKVEPTAWLRA